MGMFDRIYDRQGREWQTKALGRSLDEWSIGDQIPVDFDCQIEAIGSALAHGTAWGWTFATVRAGRLVEVPSSRDFSLPVIPYGGLGALRSVKDGSEYV